MKSIKFSCVKSYLSKSDKEIFRAVIAPNGCDDAYSICKAVGAKCGLEPELVKFVGESIFRYIRNSVADGKRVDFGQWLACLPTIKGSLAHIDDSFNPAKQRISAQVFFKQGFNGIFKDMDIVNTVVGASPKIQRVLDTSGKQDGKIKVGANVIVYISGVDIKTDVMQEGERCELVNLTTSETYNGVIFNSTNTIVDVQFPAIVNVGDGVIKLWTRGGKGGDYALKLATRNVSIISTH